MDKAKYKEPVVAVSYNLGIVRVIRPENGQIADFAVRGLRRYSKEHVTEYRRLVESGFVSQDAMWLTELPNNWDVEFEDTAIMGKCTTSINQIARAAKKAGVL